MTPQQLRVVQAEADARAARARLTASVEAIQGRIRPATLVREARREIADARTTARQLAGEKPRQTRIGGGIVAAVLLSIPLIRWRRRRRVAARAARIRGD